MRHIFYLLFSFLIFSSTINTGIAAEGLRFYKSDTLCLNNYWQFKYGTSTEDIHRYGMDSNWHAINLPHTFNEQDPYGDQDEYYRGWVSYQKTFILSEDSTRHDNYALYFEGINQEVDVFINGLFIGSHKGGYTAFNISIPNGVLKFNDKNLVTLHVSNALNMTIPPLHVGYTIYGGVYRSVFLIKRNSVFYTSNATKKVVKVIPTVQLGSSLNKGHLQIEVNLDIQINDTTAFQFQLFNAAHNLIKDTIVRIINGKENIDWPLSQVNLWSPEHPYLYSLQVNPIHKEDTWSTKIGFKHVEVSAKDGFLLNGKKYILKGTNRHQDRASKGSALSNLDHFEDLVLIKNMGCNFLRLAHYPQSNYILDLADIIGLLIWEEIPLVDYVNLDSVFIHQSAFMLKEMINQHYNHPSIVFWGIMNEIFLYDQQAKRASKIEDENYGKGVAAFALYLNKLAKSEDQFRWTTLAMHASKDYEKFGLDTITDIASYNMYNGWYNGTVNEFGSQIDKKHANSPNKKIFISEYGAESDLRLNANKPVRLDNTVQYQQYFHESYLRQIKDRPFLVGTAIWNQFDFGNPGIGGSMSNINHKGLCTWDRKIKDIYYLYKANWNTTPMVYIAAHDGKERVVKKNDSTLVTIYANTGMIDILVNRKFYKRLVPNDIMKAEISLQLQNPRTEIIAMSKVKGKLIADTCILQSYFLPSSFDTTFSSLFINIGSNAQYKDVNGVLWSPDQPYSNNNLFGYSNAVPSFVSLKNKIVNTNNTALYYSYLEGLISYKINVLKGLYELTFHFLEPIEKFKGKRVFDIYANNKLLIEDFDLSAKGFCSATSLTFTIAVTTTDGIQIDFKDKIGKPILNGLQIQKK